MRVQITDLPKPEVLRPVQPAGDTYAAPAAAPINKDLERLASSLGQFSSVMSGLAGQAMKQPRQGQASIAPLQNTGTTEDIQRAFNQSVMAGQATDPRIAELTGKTLGERRGQEFLHDLRTRLEANAVPLVDSNGTPVPVEDLFTQERSRFIGSRPESFGRNLPSEQRSPNFLRVEEGFQSTTQGFLEELRTKQRAQVFAGVRQQANNLSAWGFDNFIKAMDRPDANTTESVEALNNIKRSILDATTPGGPGPGRSSVLRGQDLDEVLLGRLRSSANDNPNAVLRILDLDTGVGPNGNRGSLGARRYQDAQSIREMAQAAANRHQERDAMEAAIRLQQQAMAQGTDLPPGSQSPQVVPFRFQRPGQAPTFTVDPDRVREEAANRNVTIMEQRMAAQFTDPAARDEATHQAVVSDLARQGVAYRPYADQMRQAARLSDPASLENPENLQRVLRAQERYERIGREAPAYLGRGGLNVPEQASDLFEAARARREMLGEPPEVALREASRMLANPGAQLTAAARQRVESEAASIGTRYLIPRLIFGGEGTVDNVMQARQRVARLAETIIRGSGMEPDKAVQAAARILQDRTVVFNGQSFMGDPNMTPELVPAWNTRIQQVIDEGRGRGKLFAAGPSGMAEITRPDQVTVVPMNNGAAYRLVLRGTATPVVTQVDQGNGQYRYETLNILPREVRDISYVERQRLSLEQRQQLEISNERETLSRFIAEQEDARREGGNRMLRRPDEQLEAARRRLQEISPPVNIPQGEAGDGSGSPLSGVSTSIGNFFRGVGTAVQGGLTESQAKPDESAQGARLQEEQRLQRLRQRRSQPQ